MSEADSAVQPGLGESLLHRRIVTPVLNQLRQGATPTSLAAALALGVVVGIFPIIGITTFLCIPVGMLLRLNQPVMQIANYAVYPLQIPLVFFFVRIGESVLRVPHVSFSIPQLMRAFRADPVLFLRQFGVTGLHGILGWSLLAIPVGALAFLALRPLIEASSRRLAR